MNTPSKSSTSVWMATAKRPEFSRLTRDEHAHVCIVGAGMAGLSTAYPLAKAGKSVIVLDDGPIFSGETERTTAHLGTVLDERFVGLDRLHGTERATLAVASHAAAIDAIEQTVLSEHIDCDFERVNGYLINAPDQPADLLDRELAAARRCGLADTDWVAPTPLPSFPSSPALLFPRQAQFHPLKYLAGVAKAFVRDGGRIFTQTHVTKIEGGPSARVETAEGCVITCDAIVMATNTPVNDRLVIHTKQAAYRSYVIGIEVPASTVAKALYWDTADPYHYVRLAATRAAGPQPAREILIVGGEDHKTGQADDAETRYARLEQWTRERFPQATEIHFRWSGQVAEPVDGLAFIGRNPMDHDNVYVATGFSGNGMTYGAITGLMLSDLIRGRANQWAELYSPARVTLAATAEFAKETLNTVAQYADWLTTADVDKDALVPPGTGATVHHGLTKVALYRDAAGTAHECSAVCPHLGAIVAWNHAEKTWDCPAHGSRFDCFGKVLNGPANQNLQPIEVAVPN